jgi:hypothetical protein
MKKQSKYSKQEKDELRAKYVVMKALERRKEQQPKEKVPKAP